MIKRVTNEIEANECDKMLNELIIDEKKYKIITTKIEHASVFNSFKQLEEKFDIQVKSIKTFNRIFNGLFYVLPVFILALAFCLNKKYLKLFLGPKGVVLIIFFVLLFIAYVIAINKIVRRYSYDNK